jgi:SAM-dependent methyltransferase
MNEAEFDLLADEYYKLHEKNIAITGESPEFFSEYKIKDLWEVIRAAGNKPENILDFGSGIGNSIPFLRKYFSDHDVICADISKRSMELAQSRFPGRESYVRIENDRLPLPDASIDVVFTACVFHHIPESEHVFWLMELKRVCKTGGLLMVYEHNPLNFLTAKAVRECPLDVNAKLIRAADFKKRTVDAGWSDAKLSYKVFFPAILALFRPLERYLQTIPIGAQYRLTARRP